VTASLHSVVADAPSGLPIAFPLLVEASIDPGNLCDPALALAMFQRQHFGLRPVEMKCNVRYLLIEPL
jgi:hypothetical protein